MYTYALYMTFTSACTPACIFAFSRCAAVQICRLTDPEANACACSLVVADACAHALTHAICTYTYIYICMHVSLRIPMRFSIAGCFRWPLVLGGGRRCVCRGSSSESCIGPLLPPLVLAKLPPLLIDRGRRFLQNLRRLAQDGHGLGRWMGWASGSSGPSSRGKATQAPITRAAPAQTTKALSGLNGCLCLGSKVRAAFVAMALTCAATGPRRHRAERAGKSPFRAE